MSRQTTVECQAQGLRSRYRYKPIAFNTGADLSLALAGETGPRGISTTSADLLDFAAAIYQIERHLKRQRTSPPERFALRMQLRQPKAWNDQAMAAAQAILYTLGDAAWELDFRSGLRSPLPEHRRDRTCTVKQVALCSGGMDSACGLASIKAQATDTQLVSFYTRQKSLQQIIASALGYKGISQWHMKWEQEAGPSHSFFYRSFLFLSLGAAIAESWGTRSLLQFENGVLATAIPPGTAWLMTRHAHPALHQYAARLFAALFGGDWEIRNPFLPLTKRDGVRAAIKAMGKSNATSLLRQTETCWFHWSNRVIGGTKKPGIPCGICIPCLIRRTAMPDEIYAYDLLRDEIKNNPRQGANFRSYYIFLKRVLETRRSPADFYAMLPPAGRELATLASPLSLNDLHQLFLKFAKEFMSTYNLA